MWAKKTWSWIPKDHIQTRTRINFALLIYVLHKKSKIRQFFLRRSRVKTERNEQKVVKHVQSCCFADVSCKTRESDVTWTRMPDGKANGCSQWFLFLCSAVSGLEKPLLAGQGCPDCARKMLKTCSLECQKVSKKLSNIQTVATWI